MIVVSNTSPLHYLVLVHAEDILHELYGVVVIPVEVREELLAENTPEKLRAWAESPPSWLQVRPSPPYTASAGLHPGETAAISLALSLRADLLLLDDREARSYAEGQGLRVTGVLGVLRDAAEQNLIDIEAALDRLRRTNFRARQSLFDEILDDFRRGRAEPAGDDPKGPG